jgi:putative endonuclease
MTPAAARCSMNAPHLLRGAAAEALAAEYLRIRGLEILARNLRCKAGEIDLVCVDGGVLAIIEVRQRESADFGGALASVTWSKRRKIILATQHFLQREKRWNNFPLRFDVLAVHGLPDGVHRVEWVKDAFRAG